MNPFDGAVTLLGTQAYAVQIRRLQARRLRQTIRHAATVPFYRDRFADARIDPRAIRTAGDLAQLPIVTRAEIQAIPVTERIPAGRDETGMHAFTTSGSTGHAVQIRQWPYERAINDLLTLRACWRYGLRPWHRKMNTRSVQPKPTSSTWKSRMGMFRRDWMVVTDPIEEWIDHLRRFRPHCIMGLTASLRVLAGYLIDHAISDIRPRFVITLGELLDPATRAAIERAFAAPVYDAYGSWEAGMIAWECPQCNGYHINADWVIVEILRNGIPAQPGEEGDVVITNLHNSAMPFVRYAQGDRAVLHTEPPVCGSRLPLLKHISGRITDNLIGRNGTTVSPHAFLTLISQTPGLRHWRLIQEREELLRLEVNSAEPLSPQTITTLNDKMAALLNAPAHLQIDYVDSLDQDRDTKCHRIICRVGEKERVTAHHDAP